MFAVTHKDFRHCVYTLQHNSAAFDVKEGMLPMKWTHERQYGE